MIDRVLREKLVDAYIASIPLFTLNVIWFLTSLLIVTAIPATGGLFYATNHLAHGRSANWRTFFRGFRMYFWRSWQWGLLNIAVALILGSNLYFYSMTQADWTMAARVIVALLALIWLAMQIYTFPLLIEQEHPHLSLALRNSIVILLKRPLFSLVGALLVAAIAVFSTLVIQPAWIFITASLCAYLANQATVNSIIKIRGKQADDARD
jgi:uncharacterized membrane protein YesL